MATNGPSPERDLLLLAVTGVGDEAQRAFEAWRARVDLEAVVDPETLALLPLLYHALQKLGLDDPFMGRLKGLCRRTWYQNRLAAECARQAVASLAAASVECLLIGDLPLTLAHHESLAARHIGSVEIAIRARHAQLAAANLHEAGLAPGSPLRDEEVAYGHARRFFGPMEQRLDLHWHFLPAASNEAADGFFWSMAQECSLEGTTAGCLSPTGMLLYHLLGRDRLQSELPRLWVADALQLLRGAAGNIDWESMVAFTVGQGLAWRLRRQMEILSGYGISMPESPLRTLRQANPRLPDIIDRIGHGQPAPPPQRPPLGRRLVLADYLRSRRKVGLLERPSDFSHFVRHRWGLRGRRQIIPTLARHFWRSRARN